MKFISLTNVLGIHSKLSNDPPPPCHPRVCRSLSDKNGKLTHFLLTPPPARYSAELRAYIRTPPPRASNYNFSQSQQSGAADNTSLRTQFTIYTYLHKSEQVTIDKSITSPDLAKEPCMLTGEAGQERAGVDCDGVCDQERRLHRHDCEMNKWNKMQLFCLLLTSLALATQGDNEFRFVLMLVDGGLYSRGEGGRGLRIGMTIN